MGHTYSHSGKNNTYHAASYNSIPAGATSKTPMGAAVGRMVRNAATVYSLGAGGASAGGSSSGLGKILTSGAKQLLQTGWQAALTGLENRISADVGGAKAALYGNPGGGYANASRIGSEYATSQAGSQGQYLSFQAAENAKNRLAAIDAEERRLKHDKTQRFLDRRHERAMYRLAANGQPAGETPVDPVDAGLTQIYEQSPTAQWFGKQWHGFKNRRVPPAVPRSDIGVTRDGRHYGSTW